MIWRVFFPEVYLLKKWLDPWYTLVNAKMLIIGCLMKDSHLYFCYQGLISLVIFFTKQGLYAIAHSAI